MLSMKFADAVVQDFAKLVGDLPEEAVASPARSTIPLVDFWRAPELRLSQLRKLLGIELLPPIDLCFEFAVDVRRGRGKPSFTDLMVVASSAAVAIEAKFTEPPYENVRTWLRTPPERNRADVLEGWLDLIRGVAAMPIAAADVMKLPYQLIHRTASACAVSRPRRVVLYQVFGNDSLDYYVKSLSAMRRCLGRTPAIDFCVLSCPVICGQVYVDLVRRRTGGERVGDAVRSALLKGTLFRCGEPALQPLEESEE
jgi:hypothetical protein